MLKWFWRVKNAIVVIQAFERMRSKKLYYSSFLRDRLWWYRASRNVSIPSQRLWRGFCGRSRARKLREMMALPNPSKAQNFEIWIRIQKEAHPPQRVWKTWAEYVLSGYPRTWDERSIKRNGIYYRDVKFWVNMVTRKSTWTQPQEWVVLDRKEFENRLETLRMGFTLEQRVATQKLQALWRAKRARKYLSFILHAKRIMDKAILTYSQNPSDITALVNYTLYVHVILVSPRTQLNRISYHFILKFTSFMVFNSKIMKKRVFFMSVVLKE